MTNLKTAKIRVPVSLLAAGTSELVLRKVVDTVLSFDDLAALGYCDVERTVLGDGFMMLRLTLGRRHPTQAVWERRLDPASDPQRLTERLLDLARAPGTSPELTTIELTSSEWVIGATFRRGARGGQPNQRYPST